MKNFVSLFVMLLVCVGSWIPVASAQDEVVPDSILRFMVADELANQNIIAGNALPFTADDMGDSRFTELTIGAWNIPVPPDPVKSLVGLEHATYLKTLTILYHDVSDLTPVGNLPNLETLNVINNNISDLTPLENLPELMTLVLTNNNIQAIPPLEKLPNLKTLTLGGNNLGDNIKGLSTLTTLTELRLDQTGVRDIAPLRGLTKLRVLEAQRNQIADISPLRNLKNLEELRLGDNQIRDISPLQDLTEVFVATFEGNQIRDISPIAGWKKIRLKGSTLNQLRFALYDFWTFKNIKVNPLSYSSIYTHLPNIMEAHIFSGGPELWRAHNVIYDFRAPTTLEVVSGDGQTVVSGEALPEPLVVRVLDENGDRFASVPVTFAVTEGEGTMDPAETATLDPTYNLRDDEEGEAQTTFTAGAVIGPQTVVATVIREGARSYQSVNSVVQETVAFEGSTTLQVTFTINVQPGAIAAPTISTVDPPYRPVCP